MGVFKRLQSGIILVSLLTQTGPLSQAQAVSRQSINQYAIQMVGAKTRNIRNIESFLKVFGSRLSAHDQEFLRSFKSERFPKIETIGSGIAIEMGTTQLIIQASERLGTINISGREVRLKSGVPLEQQVHQLTDLLESRQVSWIHLVVSTAHALAPLALAKGLAMAVGVILGAEVGFTAAGAVLGCPMAVLLESSEQQTIGDTCKAGAQKGFLLGAAMLPLGAVALTEAVYNGSANLYMGNTYSKIRCGGYVDRHVRMEQVTRGAPPRPLFEYDIQKQELWVPQPPKAGGRREWVKLDEQEFKKRLSPLIKRSAEDSAEVELLLDEAYKSFYRSLATHIEGCRENEYYETRLKWTGESLRQINNSNPAEQ